jgi:hypothetical protein
MIQHDTDTKRTKVGTNASTLKLQRQETAQRAADAEETKAALSIAYNQEIAAAEKRAKEDKDKAEKGKDKVKVREQDSKNDKKEPTKEQKEDPDKDADRERDKDSKQGKDKTPPPAPQPVASVPKVLASESDGNLIQTRARSQTQIQKHTKKDIDSHFSVSRSESNNHTICSNTKATQPGTKEAQEEMSRALFERERILSEVCACLFFLS